MLMASAWFPQLSCSQPQQHSPGRALASSKVFKAHLKEAARSQAPANFTSAAEEGHFQGLLDSQRCRQLAMDRTVESPVVDLELPLCRAGPGLTTPGSVLWLNCSRTCASPRIRIHTYSPTGTAHRNIIKV